MEPNEYISQSMDLVAKSVGLTDPKARREAFIRNEDPDEQPINSYPLVQIIGRIDNVMYELKQIFQDLDTVKRDLEGYRHQIDNK
jgi:hypothetical protein